MRTLLIRPGAIGDVIVSLPALEYLCAGETEVWAPSTVVPLIGFADRTDSIARTGLEMAGIDTSPVLLDRLANFDRIYSWYGTRNDLFREAVKGLPFTFFAALPTDEQMHAVDFYCGQAGAPAGATPRIRVTKRAAPRRTVAIHPFSGSQKKNWPLEKFRQAVEGLPVEWIAGPEDQLDGAARIPDLSELAGWLQGASLYLGNDSGISHLAAAAGVPAIVLFGPSNPKVWAPRPSRVLSAMEGLTASYVRLVINEMGTLGRVDPRPDRLCG